MIPEYDPTSYADPHGRLHPPGRQDIHRSIYPHQQPLIGRALRSEAVLRLIQSRRLIETTVVDGPPESPRELAHRLVWPVSYPPEWPAVMLADAGLLILEVAKELLGEGLCLNDGTPRNVLFDGAAPVFVDFTSIVEAPAAPVWRPFDQFAREVMYPLYLASWNRTAEWRYQALSRPRAGISAGSLVEAMPLSFRLRRPLRAAVLRAMGRRETPARTGAVEAARTPAPERTRALLQLFFGHLQAELERLRRALAKRASGGWSGYYDTDVTAADTAAKSRVLGEVLRRARPDRVVDLGTNTGHYAIAATELDARVVAVDIDESCLARLAETSRSRQLPLTPLLMDAACPTPSFGLGGSEFPAAPARFAPDLTMALGVVHHLVRHSDYTLDRLADAFASYQSRVLLVEFVGPTDPRAAQLGLAARSGYTLDAARAAVGRHYPRVSVLPTYGDRHLIVGEQ